MLPQALNQMTVPDMPLEAFLQLAHDTGCVGVELRNDLGRPLFDGIPAAEAAAMATAHDLHILAMAELKAFNIAPERKSHDALALIRQAADAGSAAVALIPQVGTDPIARSAQRDLLRAALIQLKPVLEDHDLVGLIEPIGFVTSSLRHKDDVCTVLDDLGSPDCFRILHDTFHHHLSGDHNVAADRTGLVHVSGVTVAAPTATALTDAHRGLIDADDQLQNVQQIRALQRAGYDGPISVECFAPDVHQLTDPGPALARSFAFIASQTAAEAA